MEGGGVIMGIDSELVDQIRVDVKGGYDCVAIAAYHGA